jgi:hypothetical protein
MYLTVPCEEHGDFIHERQNLASDRCWQIELTRTTALCLSIEADLSMIGPFRDSEKSAWHHLFGRNRESRTAVPNKAVRLVSPHVGHKSRAETHDAGLPRTANTWIYDSERPGRQEPLCDALRFNVAVRIQVFSECLNVPEVVKLRSEICPIVVVRYLVVETPDFGKVYSLVEGDLGL